jgi:glutaredoxin 1
MSYVIYGRENCNWCMSAKKLLEDHGKEYRYIDINEDVLSKAFLVDQGFKTVPQIWLDKDHIGGYSELHSVIFG